jgi:hypothetical protein
MPLRMTASARCASAACIDSTEVASIGEEAST